MNLREFIDAYGVFCETDEDIILAWARLNNKELELIKLISTLAANMHNDFRQKERRTWEWVYYAAQSIMPEIKEDTDGTTLLNVLRMYHMAYDNDESFVKRAKELEKATAFDWAAVEGLHPDIVARYRKACLEYGNNE